MAVIVVGCGGTGGTAGPAAASTAAYLHALTTDDAHAAYDLLAPAVRRAVGYREFAAMWTSSKAERAWQAGVLGEASIGTTATSAHVLVRFDDGQSIAMEREADAWRLDTPIFYRAHAPQPRDVVTALADALEHRDLEGVIGTLSRERRDAVGDQVHGLLRGVAEHRNDAIDQYGTDEAELRWDDASLRYRILLRRENGDWKVADVSIRPIPLDGSADDRGTFDE